MDPEWLTVVRRTQRDLSRDLPLQRIPLPAVHVPSVMCALLKGQSSPSPQRPINDSALVRTCLPTGTSRSVSQAFRTAITSMLDQGYRRLEVDVYHSTLDGSWQLCPWNTSSTIGSGGGSSTLVVTAQDDCTIWPTLLSPVFDWIDGRNNLYNWDTVMLVLYPQTIESDAGTPVTEALPFADILSDSRRSGMVYTPAMHGQLVQSGILPDAETWLSKFQMYRRSRMLILGYADDVDSVEQRVPTYNATLDAGTVFEVDAINGDRSATEYCDDRDIFAMDIVEDCADVLSAVGSC